MRLIRDIDDRAERITQLAEDAHKRIEGGELTTPAQMAAILDELNPAIRLARKLSHWIPAK